MFPHRIDALAHHAGQFFSLLPPLMLKLRHALLHRVERRGIQGLRINLLFGDHAGRQQECKLVRCGSVRKSRFDFCQGGLQGLQAVGVDRAAGVYLRLCHPYGDLKLAS